MSAALTLRPAAPLDAGRVGTILDDFTDETAWMPRIHTRAETISFAGTMIDRGWVTVAETDGAVNGFLAQDADWINSLFVDRSARRIGMGRALLAEAQEASDTLQLWTFQANHDAQAFYRAHGFVEAERTDGATNDEKLPDIRMTWERT